MPSVIGVVPYVGLNFCVYESLKDAVIQATGRPRAGACMAARRAAGCTAPKQPRAVGLSAAAGDERLCSGQRELVRVSPGSTQGRATSAIWACGRA